MLGLSAIGKSGEACYNFPERRFWGVRADRVLQEFAETFFLAERAGW